MDNGPASTVRLLPILTLGAAVVAGGCEQPKELAGGAPLAEDYAGNAGTIFGYAVSAESADPLVSLAISSSTWEFRTGNDWDDAVPVASYAMVLDGALVVDGKELLPSSFEAGTSYAGLYGEYADTASRTLTDGSFAGKWIFARNIGPIYIALNGIEYEMVTYQNNALDTGS